MVELLLEKGANVNMADNEGVTPLRLAIREGHEEIIRLLFTGGVDINAPSTNLNNSNAEQFQIAGRSYC